MKKIFFINWLFNKGTFIMLKEMFQFIDIYANAITAMGTLFALVLSVIALYQTHKQLKISNQQTLFDRRISNFIVFRDIFNSCESAIELMKSQNKDEIDLACDYVSLCFGNNSVYLADACLVFDNPLDRDDEKPKRHCQFLAKLQDMRNKSFEANVIFKDRRISDYYRIYSEFLRKSYQYVICVDNIKKINIDYSSMTHQFKTKEEISNEVGESKIRYEWFLCFEALERIHLDLKQNMFDESIFKVW